MRRSERSFATLAFNKAYNRDCAIHLNGGREIILDRLDQADVYENLLVGVPDCRHNQGYIQSLLQQAGSKGAKVHLIEPPRRDFWREPGDMQSRREKRADRIPEWLPSIYCIGRFSSKAIPSSTDPLSTLTIVWFQDEFAPPLQLAAYEAIAAIDWDSLAEGFSP